ncbi:hypothetical protein BpHYR1_045137 [Brachionus plicatilis]|uniref:Uncharacterized protein n=1 Tax=Brachionus plicatilis TaxID=10195 RepID=A0A3M7QPB9_BRAPC|nr:hypothetical protein BpHYR1_045137 [Brachionus plicatilis]
MISALGLMKRIDDHVAFTSELKAAAARNLHVRTLKFADHGAIARKHGHMKPVAMTISNKHVSSIAHIDTVRKVGDVLAANAAHKISHIVKHSHTMSLKIAHIILVAIDGNVAGLAHILRAVEPLFELAILV